MRDNRPGEGHDARRAALRRHFVRRLSFEPRAEPRPGKLELGFGVDLQTRQDSAGDFELELRLRLEAKAGDAPQFLLEIAYAGVFALPDLPREVLQRVLLIDAPHLLFPFLRDLALKVVRDAGYAPPELTAISFAELYRARTGAVPAPVEGLQIDAPGHLRELFPTPLYNAPLGADLHGTLEAACLALAQADDEGRAWCRANAYRGYTSYATVRDLPQRAPVFAELVAHLDRHVAAFGAAAEFDMRGRRLVLDGIWINVMEEGCMHASHIHPHAAVSGTYYVAMPGGAAAICFEDPRSGLMMAAPPRDPAARPENRAFLSVNPQAGTLLLWESWLRHGVEMQGPAPRISISFNYRIDAT